MINSWTNYNGCYTFTTFDEINYSICPEKRLLPTGKYEDSFVVYLDVDEMGKFDTLKEAMEYCIEIDEEIFISPVEVSLERVDKPIKDTIYHHYQRVSKDIVVF